MQIQLKILRIIVLGLIGDGYRNKRQIRKFQILIFFLLISCGNNNQVVYTNFIGSFTSSNNDWNKINKDNHSYSVNSCGGQTILFIDNLSTQYNVLLHKSFSLNPHYSVTIELKLWQIDNWNNNAFLIYYDNQVLLNQQYTCSASATNLCGDSSLDEFTSISIDFLHDRPSIQIAILAQSGKWGISDFRLKIEECPSGCPFCNSSECIDQILFFQSFTSILIQTISASESWTSQGTLSDLIDYCHDLYYHKSPGSQFVKTIILDKHIAISLKIKVMILNSSSTTVIINIDNVIVLQQSYTSTWIDYINTDKNFDGFWYHYTQKNVDIFDYAHNQNQITIKIETTMSSHYTPWAPWFGIRDFQLFLKKFKIDQPKEICNDFNLVAFDGCFSFNYDCVFGCKFCVKGVCLGCQDEFQYININKSCVPICGDGIITSLEECDDGNTNLYDGCHNCKFSCPLECDICEFGVCNQWSSQYQYQKLSNQCLPSHLVSTPKVKEQYYIPECKVQVFSNYFQSGIPINHHIELSYYCQLNCKFCIYEICQECKENYILKDSICISTQQNLEEDYNNIQNFGHNSQSQNLIQELFYQMTLIKQNQDFTSLQQLSRSYYIEIFCRYLYKQDHQKKIDYCSYYLMDICQECKNGYIFSKSHKECIPQCNDGMVLDYEICDDKNNLQFDGCYKCELSCQLECLSCINGICLTCLDGWSLINNVCQQLCGDGSLAIYSIEQCDDKNDIDADGCFQCMLECLPYCQICVNQYQCLYCQDYFELLDDKCIPICGDSIIIEGLEECDDGNQIPNDGCTNCQFQCEYNCKICINGLCKEFHQQIEEEPEQNITEPIQQTKIEYCIQGCQVCLEDKCLECEEFSTFEDQQCIRCGNGYKSDDEFCDDGNNFNNDGCSDDCHIEFGWDCILSTLKISQCYTITELSLTFLNISFDTQYVGLTYTKKVKLDYSNPLFFEQTSFFVQDVNPDQYNLTIQPITAINLENAQNINYHIQITFLEKIEFTPTLNVSIYTKLLDENEIIVPPNQKDIQLRVPQVMNQFQIQTTQNFQQIGENIMMGLGGLGVLLLICGQFIQFLEILDIFQYQSNLKFINLDYPQNLYIYFKSSEFVQLNSILIDFKVNDKLNLIINEENLKSKGKFFEYDINADFLSNIYALLIQILVITLVYLLLFIFKCFEKHIYFKARYFYNLRLLKSKIVNQIAIKVYQVYRKIHKVSYVVLGQQFILLFQTNSWDLIFKSLLYLDSNKITNLRSQISISLCLAFFILIGIRLIIPFRRADKKLIIQKIKDQQLESMNLLKKLLFLSILIKLQDLPLLQNLLLSFCQLFFIGSVWCFQLLSSKFELLMIVLIELPIMMFTLINLCFCSDFSQYFTENTKLLIGFGQMGILLIGLCGPFIKLGKQLSDQIKRWLNSRSRINKQKMMTPYCFQMMEI